MKLRSVLMTGALAATLLAVPAALTASTAVAATTTQVWVTNAFTYGVGNPFDFTVCLDGSPLASLSTTDTSGPTDVTSGDHEVEVFGTLGSDCNGKPNFTKNINIPATAAVTLALWWPFDSSGTVDVIPEDMSCVQPGTGRVTFRNLAAYDSSDTMDLRGTPPGGTDAALISAIQQADQGTNVVSTGSYTNASVNWNGSNVLVANVGQGILPVSETTQEIVYAYGGGDGAIGVYIAELPSTPCPVATTVAPATTAAPTTTVAPTQAPAAEPVSVQPTYTG